MHSKDKVLEIFLKSESLNGLLFTFFKIKGVFAWKFMPKKDREWMNWKAKFMDQRLHLRFTFFHELIIFNNPIHS